MCGEFIRNKRKELGLTQAQLAEKLYISNKAVSKWETGESNPDIELLPKIAEVLGVTVDALLGVKPQKVDREDTVPLKFTPMQMTKLVLYIIFTCFFAILTALFIGVGILAIEEIGMEEISATPEEQAFVVTVSFVLAAVFALCTLIICRKALRYARLYGESRISKLRINCQNSGYKLFSDLTAEEKKAFNKEYRKKVLPALIVLIACLALHIVSALIKNNFPIIAGVIDIVSSVGVMVAIIVSSVLRNKLMSKNKYVE